MFSDLAQGGAPQSPPKLSAVVAAIQAETRTPGFNAYLEQLLLELCRIDTTPKAEIAHMQSAEAGCFGILERELSGLKLSARLERRPINPGIQKHSHYSLLHFTKTPAQPQGLPPELVYANRSNLICVLPGANRYPLGCSVAVNGHLDVVAPYFPPRSTGGIVYGRGACDDKGPVVSLVAAFKVLERLAAKTGLRLNRDVVGMFVVEEETGGNGSLSLAMDRDLKRLYDSILVCECTGLKFHPANRGAVWYRAELTPPDGVSAVEMFAFINEEMEKEGAAIRAESRHPLFPQRPVQTCHGIIGSEGEHPSRICGETNFWIGFAKPGDPRLEELVRDCLESGLAGYVGLYGDKTKVLDPSGQPVVARHYDLLPEGNGFHVRVFGAAGHMGAIRERDGAITKMAHLVRGLIYSRAKLEGQGGKMELKLKPYQGPFVLEGGQGFVPTHGIEEIMTRMRQAAERGAENYLRWSGRREAGAECVRVTYEKLHNVAFDGEADSPTVRNAIAAAKACGIWDNQPVLGWTVSCDARLFATEYPGLPVLTFGPGQLVHAHSDQEQIAIEDLRKAVEFLCAFILVQTGTVE